MKEKNVKIISFSFSSPTFIILGTLHFPSKYDFEMNLILTRYILKNSSHFPIFPFFLLVLFCCCETCTTNNKLLRIQKRFIFNSFQQFFIYFPCFYPPFLLLLSAPRLINTCRAFSPLFYVLYEKLTKK